MWTNLWELDMPFRSKPARIALKVFLGLVLASIAMAGNAAGQTLDEGTRVSLNFATIFAVGAMAFPLVWKISTTMQKMSDRLENIERRADSNYNMINKLDDTIDGLACRTLPPDCPGGNQKKGC
jgi:hypothetical protein